MKLNASLLESGAIKETSQIKKDLPEKVIQFGQGNFLRGYLDWMLHQMNQQGLFNGSVVVVQPSSTGPVIPMMNEQNGLFTVVLRGVENGAVVDKKEVITSISRGLNATLEWADVLKIAASRDLEFVFSNTTEAGITYVKEDYVIGEPPQSFPGKLTAFLYHRFQMFDETKGKGLTILPCELIEDNGKKLKELVLQKADDWHLSEAFRKWIEDENIFCDTLVDRIVTGFPKDNIEEFNEMLGYEDEFLTVGEPYHMLAVDGPESVKKALPFDKAGLNVNWGDITPHRELKVRLLNGPHTMMFAVSFLYGVDTVLEVMEDENLRAFVEQGFNEISPTVPAVEGKKEEFISDVKERFLNPYNKHFLVDIGLNAVFKYRARLLPTLQRFVDQQGSLPEAIVFSLAALMKYYQPKGEKDGSLVGERNGTEYEIRDNEAVLKRLSDGWNQVDNGGQTLGELVDSFLSDEDIWGEDLNKIQGLNDMVTEFLASIVQVGMKATVKGLVNK